MAISDSSKKSPLVVEVVCNNKAELFKALLCKPTKHSMPKIIDFFISGDDSQYWSLKLLSSFKFAPSETSVLLKSISIGDVFSLNSLNPDAVTKKLSSLDSLSEIKCFIENSYEKSISLNVIQKELIYSFFTKVENIEDQLDFLTSLKVIGFNDPDFFTNVIDILNTKIEKTSQLLERNQMSYEYDESLKQVTYPVNISDVNYIDHYEQKTLDNQSCLNDESIFDKAQNLEESIILEDKKVLSEQNDFQLVSNNALEANPPLEVVTEVTEAEALQKLKDLDLSIDEQSFLINKINLPENFYEILLSGKLNQDLAAKKFDDCQIMDTESLFNLLLAKGIDDKLRAKFEEAFLKGSYGLTSLFSYRLIANNNFVCSQSFEDNLRKEIIGGLKDYNFKEEIQSLLIQQVLNDDDVINVIQSGNLSESVITQQLITRDFNLDNLVIIIDSLSNFDDKQERVLMNKIDSFSIFEKQQFHEIFFTRNFDYKFGDEFRNFISSLKQSENKVNDRNNYSVVSLIANENKGYKENKDFKTASGYIQALKTAANDDLLQSVREEAVEFFSNWLHSCIDSNYKAFYYSELIILTNLLIEKGVEPSEVESICQETELGKEIWDQSQAKVSNSIFGNNIAI